MTEILSIGPVRAARPGKATTRRTGDNLASRLLREPLLHFLLVGGLLFLAARQHADANDRHRIVIDDSRVAQLTQTWSLQYGSAPTEAMRETLLRKWIDEEALYREGVARGVDKDDEIIRRRVIQKMQFLTQDLAATPDPRDSDLRAYYQGHLAKYRTLERVTFSHVFFSPDTRGDAAAKAAAEEALATLQPETVRAPERGDRFADRYDYAGLDPTDAGRLFGRSDFSQALFGAPVGRWSGPYRSGFGWHLARIESRTPSSLPPFEAVAGQVRDDYIADARADADAEAIADLEKRYTVVRQDGSAGP